MKVEDLLHKIEETGLEANRHEVVSVAVDLGQNLIIITDGITCRVRDTKFNIDLRWPLGFTVDPDTGSINLNNEWPKNGNNEVYISLDRALSHVKRMSS